MTVKSNSSSPMLTVNNTTGSTRIMGASVIIDGDVVVKGTLTFDTNEEENKTASLKDLSDYAFRKFIEGIFGNVNVKKLLEKFPDDEKLKEELFPYLFGEKELNE